MHPDDMRHADRLALRAMRQQPETATMKYTARIAFNVPYYATIEFEAADDATAIEHAKQAAHDVDGDYIAGMEHADEHRVVEVVKDDDEDNVIAQNIAV